MQEPDRKAVSLWRLDFYPGSRGGKPWYRGRREREKNRMQGDRESP